jgi:hypothetical protein
MSPLAESRVGLPLWIKELSDGGEIPYVLSNHWVASLTDIDWLLVESFIATGRIR